ncbi:6655_t:CDS:2 [Dentiscutata erythropus]|uniref:6655_t:CDS:1 n=1 Tax=Dentiscutata erythropus TaxID=1348616 RepID=A0A9N8VG42_9GLOM|nr:6655_t:CDS:2 [Dentiscutata erythropus]
MSLSAILHTDNGSEYVGNDFKEMLNSNLPKIKIAHGHPRTFCHQGLVEKENNILQIKLGAWMKNTENNNSYNQELLLENSEINDSTSEFENSNLEDSDSRYSNLEDFILTYSNSTNLDLENTYLENSEFQIENSFETSILDSDDFLENLIQNIININNTESIKFLCYTAQQKEK